MKSKQPNVIIILADDMGIGDLECYNPQSKIPTPHMNQLAQEGVSFTDAHSSSAVCTPSRYGILTGRYCWRTQLTSGVLGGYAPPLIEQGRHTIASVLKEQGYTTAAIGKWHVGMDFYNKSGQKMRDAITYSRHVIDDPADTKVIEEMIDFSAKITGGPTELGFDYFYGTAACSTCNSPYAFIENDHFETTNITRWEDHMYTSRAGMMADGWDHKEVDVVFTNKAVSYIKEQSKQEKPFFLYLAASAPHEPCVESVVPEFARGKSKAGHRGDLVWLFDYMVGQVSAALNECGLQDDTVVIVTSDNGALPGERFLQPDGSVTYETFGHKASGDFKGYKSHYWEGGHREPLLIKWPDKVKPNTNCDALVGLNDLSATIAQIANANASLPSDAFADAVSFLPCVTQNSDSVRTNLIHHSVDGVFAFRYGKWKLVVDAKGNGGWPPLLGEEDIEWPAFQLYDMEIDPAERHNIYSENLQLAQKLETILREQIAQGSSSQRCCLSDEV